jgi:methionyl-tRNA formyltransferase
VYASAAIEIGRRETAEELQDRLAMLGADLLVRHLDEILAGSLTPVDQDDAGATYAPRIDKAAAVIDWTQSAAAIDRQIRAYRPWPVAETTLAGEQLRCWRAGPLAAGEADERAGEPGRVLAAGADGILVCTGDGWLSMTELQMPGRRRMSAADFARGHDLVGRRLGAGPE